MQGFWFQLGAWEKQQAKYPWGPANPQALNRYSYVLNNPVRYTDPTGHISWEEAAEAALVALLAVGVVAAAPVEASVAAIAAAAVAVVGAALVLKCVTDEACRQGVIELAQQGQATIDSLTFVLQAEIRETSTGEKVRVRKLSQAEVKKRGWEESKARQGYGPRDDIYYDKKNDKYYIGSGSRKGVLEPFSP